MKIYELLNSKDKWTRKAEARDKNDIRVHCSSSKAVKWCLMGAVEKLYKSDYHNIREKIMLKIPCNYIGPVWFNDDSTYEQVIALCRELDI